MCNKKTPKIFQKNFSKKRACLFGALFCHLFNTIQPAKLWRLYKLKQYNICNKKTPIFFQKKQACAFGALFCHLNCAKDLMTCPQSKIKPRPVSSLIPRFLPQSHTIHLHSLCNIIHIQNIIHYIMTQHRLLEALQVPIQRIHKVKLF